MRIRTPPLIGSSVSPTNVNITGVSGTGSVGTLAIQLGTFVDVTGVSGTGSVGVLSVGGETTFEITGVSGTGSIGAVDVSTTVTRTLTNALPMKNNTGTLQANLTDLIINVYSTVDGTLEHRFTGQTTDASGYWSVSNDQLGLGTWYVVNVLHLNGEASLNSNANKGITIVQAT